MSVLVRQMSWMELLLVLGSLKIVLLNPSKPGIGEVIPIFWTVNAPPGLQGLNKELLRFLPLDEKCS